MYTVKKSDLRHKTKEKESFPEVQNAVSAERLHTQNEQR